MIEPPHRSAWSDMFSYVGDAIEDFQEKNRPKMIDSVFKFYEMRGVLPDKDGIWDMEVSFDGSWMNRGHESQIWRCGGSIYWVCCRF